MRGFSCDTVMEKITYAIEFQLRKYGNYGPATTVEEAINQLTNFELLVLIDAYLEEESKVKGEVTNE